MNIRKEIFMSIYEIRVEDVDKNVITLDQYKGKVLLIVNTATTCFFTPQYDGLQKLYNMFKKRGFEILDFPSNQFNDAKDSIDKIDEFCVKHYKADFKDRKSTRLNSSHVRISYAVFC